MLAASIVQHTFAGEAGEGEGGEEGMTGATSNVTSTGTFKYSQCCQLSGVSFHIEMSSFPDFQLHFRIFFVRCLALSFDIPAAVGSKLGGKAGRGGSTRPSLFWCPDTEFSSYV